MSRQLIKGNYAVAETAIRVGLDAYFGYPITPQTELLEWMSKRMPEEGRTFLQAESELGAINMVYGAACCGVRVMTSSSGPGMSLMMEGISYIAATNLPVVMVDVMRAGPGLGNVDPAQSDYNQIVHGGGHGDYYLIALAPSTVQEAVDFTGLAFDLAEKYRCIVVLLMDGCLGQMMEPAELPPLKSARSMQKNWTPPEWAVSGKNGRARRVLTSIFLDPIKEEGLNIQLLKQWQVIKANEVRYHGYYLEDAEFVVVGFGTSGRIALTAVRAARAEGIRVGLLRPITVSPFPYDILTQLSKAVKAMLVVEMNAGQMLEDVRRAAGEHTYVGFYGRYGGIIPFPDEILEEIRRLARGDFRRDQDPVLSWLEKLEDARIHTVAGR